MTLPPPARTEEAAANNSVAAGVFVAVPRLLTDIEGSLDNARQNLRPHAEQHRYRDAGSGRRYRRRRGSGSNQKAASAAGCSTVKHRDLGRGAHGRRGRYAVAFEVQRLGEGGACSVTWTKSGTTQPNDFKAGTAFTGTLAWDADDTTLRRIELPLRPDKTDEPNETTIVTLSKPVGCRLAVSSDTVLVRDDDEPVVVPPDDSDDPKPPRFEGPPRGQEAHAMRSWHSTICRPAGCCSSRVV